MNATEFKACGFSGFTAIPSQQWDSDYVIAATQHKVYIWDRVTGTLAKMLEGTKEVINSMEWHPYRPIIACAVAEIGKIYIWNKTIAVENFWSAFAPNFSEVEVNEYYLEREDEYDLDDEEDKVEQLRKSKQQELEDADVDILTVDRTTYDSDVSEEDVFLPVDPIPEADLRRAEQFNIMAAAQYAEQVKADRNKKKKSKKPKKKRKRKASQWEQEDSASDDSEDDDYA